ncbi:Fe-S cluster assembly sulfur transfer protein SufU [Cellulomonas carbonis]|uniref:Nitrogen fixation protein NifU n=1 Tax=Cellulomonas carbonis T26 TaxID=947969 RepID=A0A0A0BWF1_9CELL|nr:SUF system NifU family Fe-S cluster assembly protein [Cellulomonas carbonis]KGM12221.1 nitrogen fixation protein NifU [Cellulomonas carbonis T26]GGB96498.1 iron-sulfur cluster assembly scaffold protein NifU [Cellulomonas carbonis]
MSSMEQMYQQLILDHAKSPHGRGLVEGHAAESFQVNPTCGDEVRLRVHLGDAGIDRVSWEGQGCSISQASISVMAELVEGVPVTEAEQLGETFRALMQARGEGLDEQLEDTLGDATAFTGVAKYPARIKCALLGWAALRDALAQSGAATTQEGQA